MAVEAETSRNAEGEAGTECCSLRSVVSFAPAAVTYTLAWLVGAEACIDAAWNARDY